MRSGVLPHSSKVLCGVTGGWLEGWLRGLRGGPPRPAFIHFYLLLATRRTIASRCRSIRGGGRIRQLSSPIFMAGNGGPTATEVTAASVKSAAPAKWQRSVSGRCIAFQVTPSPWHFLVSRRGLLAAN